MPSLPRVPGTGSVPVVHDSVSGQPQPAATGSECRLYVCGITPYDATHLGHAATYVGFDILVRALHDAGVRVRYVQNVTDVDEPLFERAARDAVDWRELATSQIDLFREDMTALAVIPPEAFVGVQEAMPVIAATVQRLIGQGRTYEVPASDGEGADVYLDLAQVRSFGSVSGWPREEMIPVFGERGGDPDTPGKRSPLDPLLWRAKRLGEPSWELAGLPAGRPGWHVECTAIAGDYLGLPFDVQGGGSDLIFPHHEMSDAQADGAFARLYVHQGMVGYEGEKMSKSRGNLVLVSQLRAAGVDPMAIRLVLLAHHYREDWEYTPAQLEVAQERLARWREAMSVNAAPPAGPTVDAIRAALADDLDAPAAIRAVDDWVDTTLAAVTTQPGDRQAGGGPIGTSQRSASPGELDAAAPGIIDRAVDALLGVRA